jgi:uncharacterized protein YbjT (DUF2867 family)
MSDTNSDAVLVIGATGTTGRHICRYLAESGAQVVAASRSGDAPPGAHGIHFDWHDAASWNVALTGVDRMYLIAPSGASDPVTVMGPFLDRALECGVKRAVLQSSSLIEAGGPVLGPVHAMIADRFPEWAVLRPSWFMQNFSDHHWHAAAIRERGEITTAAGSGRVGFIDVRDIARVAASVLLADAAPNSDPILTGPQALNHDEVAAIISRVSEVAVTHVTVGPERMKEIYEADGLPADYATMLADLDVQIACGAEDRVTEKVVQLTGTPPRSLEEFAAEVSWRRQGT